MRIFYKPIKPNFDLKSFKLVLVFALVPILFGCGGLWGTLQPSAEVTNDFNQNIYKPDYKYYYSGRENVPTAIVGISSPYALEDDFWTRIPPNSEALEKMVMRLYPTDFYTPYGYHMLGPDGQKIGILFSERRRVAIKLLPGNKVQILLYDPTGSIYRADMDWIF